MCSWLLAPRVSQPKITITAILNSCLAESIWPEDEFKPGGSEVSIFKRITPCSNIFDLSFKKSLGELHSIPFSPGESSGKKFFSSVLGLV